ncbi:MAG TPA: DNA polymerase III subunit delta [Xanthobacteraceae bacterium]|jgi:DNA polymerase-3 subunit delta
MVALKAREVERYIARPDPGKPIILVYGADAGLVQERADTLIREFVEDPRDPFQLVRLEGDELAGEPARLVEEANTVGLFGGRRAIWVKTGGRNFVPAVEALLAGPAPTTRVVIQAGDLRRNAPLRTICERAKAAITLPCYADDEDALLRLIETEMRESGLAISADARAALVPLLGGDRLSSRHELRKLVLFAHGRSRVELDDVRAVVSDASKLELDELVDAAFSGDAVELEVQLGKARIAGTSPGTIMTTALRQVGQLHRARLAIDNGATPDEAVSSIVPFGFGRKGAIARMLRMWTSARLLRAMTQLADQALQARRQSDMAAVIAHRALLAVAVNASSKSRPGRA